ncbi:MAG: DUF1194 domain-containing protein [Boseongicola sp.]|nr:DUF1194 domain-containing protein [Boseongicola sp.]
MVKPWAALAGIALALMPGPALACRLALALAVDISTSIDSREYALQRDGLAAALTAPEVVSAFLGHPQPVALAVYEWSGQRQQQLIIDWTLIDNEAAMFGVAAQISRQERTVTGYPTSLGHALRFGAELMRSAPSCWQHTLDVSGDGRNNDGYPPAVAFRHFEFSKMTINGLAIGGAEEIDSLVTYFRNHVIHGPGAFVEIADDHYDFERAMRQKLEREVATRAVSRLDIDP